MKNILLETFAQTSISFKCSSSMYGSKSNTASILTGPVPKCISTISIFSDLIRFGEFCFHCNCSMLVSVSKKRWKWNEKDKLNIFHSYTNIEESTFFHASPIFGYTTGISLVCSLACLRINEIMHKIHIEICDFMINSLFCLFTFKYLPFFTLWIWVYIWFFAQAIKSFAAQTDIEGKIFFSQALRFNLTHFKLTMAFFPAAFRIGTNNI